MSEDAENSRPAKRPRISPLLPDGFAQKSTTEARYGAPKFVSGFTNASGSGASGNNTRRLQPAQRPDFGAVAPTPATKVRVLKPPHLERISASTPSHSGSKPLNTGGAQKAKLAAVTALRHVLPAPAQASNIAGQTDRQPRTVVNILQHPPVFTKTSHAMSLKPISVAPPRPISDKPLPPSPSKLKTISTTRVAKATDPRTENGPIELLSIFLQQRGIELVDPVEKELRRGLERTPEKNKGGKGKGKYVRGGLAESFSRRFMQDSTDQKLWEEQMTRSFADGKRVKADLRLQSLTIIHRSPERLPNKPHAPMAGPNNDALPTVSEWERATRISD